MDSKKTAYRKLPGRGAKHSCLSMIVWSRASLWMGPDHLLSVTNTGYAEDYRRFYYRDIQAISVTRTNRMRNWIIGLLSAALVFYFLSMAVPAGAMPFFWVLCGVLVALALINWLLGPTTRAFLYTAVSREELPSLGRLKNAEKALDLLRPAIEKEQGRLTLLELRELPEPVTDREAPPAQPARATRPPEPVRQATVSSPPALYNGRWHEIFFLLLVLGGIQDIVSLSARNLALSLFSTLTVWMITIAVIVAIVKQQESPMKGWLRAAPGVTLGFVWISYLAGFIVNMSVIVTNPALRRNQFNLFRAISEISPHDHPVLLGFTLFSIVFSFGIGISGLIFAHLYRQRLSDAASGAGPGGQRP